MNAILILTQRLRDGYGVSVLVDSLARELVKLGHETVVGCFDMDHSKRPYSAYLIRPQIEDVRALARSLGKPHIVAQTSPFFELLPELAGDFPCWAWENGDPTPSLFSTDRKERETTKANKETNVYPKLYGVCVISDFLRHDINYLNSKVIHLGCDHAPDLGGKAFNLSGIESTQPLKIGTLMRLGEGEAQYKGNEIFMQLCQDLKSASIPIEAYVMGKGSEADARSFKEAGIQVKLNASESEKWEYLRSLDIFVSCSLWEGFNLPLVEAQAMGTVAFAFDVGAHPEVTPYVFSDLPSMVTVIRRFSQDRELLHRACKASYSLTRSQFKWSKAALELVDFLGITKASHFRSRGLFEIRFGILFAVRNGIRRFQSSLKSNGWRSTTARLYQRAKMKLK